MSFDNGLGDGKAQTYSFVFLGGEERIEDSSGYGSGNAGPGVCDKQVDSAAGAMALR
jgi:hypothetical protein